MTPASYLRFSALAHNGYSCRRRRVIHSGSVKKSNPAPERFEALVNKARNESQKTLLLRYVLDKTMSNCSETLQHARELRNLSTTRPKKAA